MCNERENGMSEKNEPVWGKTGEWMSFTTPSCSFTGTGDGWGLMSNPYVPKVTATVASPSWPGPANENMIGVEPKASLRGLMVFRVAVGQLPPEKAEALLQTFAEQNSDVIERLSESGFESIILHTRTSDSVVEYIKL